MKENTTQLFFLIYIYIFLFFKTAWAQKIQYNSRQKKIFLKFMRPGSFELLQH